MEWEADNAQRKKKCSDFKEWICWFISFICDLLNTLLSQKASILSFQIWSIHRKRPGNKMCLTCMSLPAGGAFEHTGKEGRSLPRNEVHISWARMAGELLQLVGSKTERNKVSKMPKQMATASKKHSENGLQSNGKCLDMSQRLLSQTEKKSHNHRSCGGWGCSPANSVSSLAVCSQWWGFGVRGCRAGTHKKTVFKGLGKGCISS